MYTISSPSGRGMSVDYKSVLDWWYLAPFWRHGQKSRKIAKFWLILTPRNFFGGQPPKFWNQFWVLLFRDHCRKKFGPRPLTLRGWD